MAPRRLRQRSVGAECAGRTAHRAEASIDPIIAREAELARLTAFVDRIGTDPGALLLSGGLGAGKTTIWRRGVELARARPATVLVARPGEQEAALPYAALADLLGTVSEPVFAMLPAVQRRAVEVALLRTEPEGPALQQRAVAAGVVLILQRMAAAGPLLLAIDDTQWLDPPSLRVLQFAVRRLAEEPVGLLVATRADDPGRDVLGVRSAYRGDQVETAEIRPLALDAIGRLLRVTLGLSLTAPTLRRLHAISGGNPFFALEMGRALLRQDAPPRTAVGLPVPDTLRDLVLGRLYRLPGEARDVLGVVAALSRPTIPLVRAALDDGQRLDAAIGRARDAGIIELDDDRIRFSHPLLGSVLYEELAPDARRSLHRRLAAVSTELEERAHHLALATTGPDGQVAATLDEAAGRARARGAPDTAATLAEQARRLTPLVDTAGSTRRTLTAAEAWLEAGASARAAELLEPLVRTLQPGPDLARALLAMGRVRMFDDGLGAAAPWLERAAAVAGDDALLQASIGRDLSTSLTQTGALEPAAALARTTLAWAERAASPDLTAAALAQLAMVEFLAGRGMRMDLLERADALGASVEPGIRSGAAAFVPTDLVWGAVLKWSDSFDLARHRFEAVRRDALALGDETPWVSLLFQAGELELWAGDWAAADALVAESEAAIERRGDPPQQEIIHLRAALAAHRGRFVEAAALTRQALAGAERIGDLRFQIRGEAVLGFIELSAGKADRALHHLERAHEQFTAAGYDDPGVIRFVPDLVEALVARGEIDRAGRVQAWLEGRGRALDRPYALACAARCRAVLLAATDRTSEALEAIAEALGHHARLAQPFELGRTRLVEGSLLRRTKARREARAVLEAAASIFDALGASAWALRAGSELGRISGRAPTTGGLTPTEAHVARLAAEGYGNAEIAQQLFVTTKTVEAHLTRIYDKLGVRSRGELARRSRSGEFPDVGSGGTS